MYDCQEEKRKYKLTITKAKGAVEEITGPQSKSKRKRKG